MIVEYEGVYTGDLHNKRFTVQIFKDNVSRTGDVISFVSPVNISYGDFNLQSTKSLNLLLEIPEVSKFGGCCFQYLYNTQLGFLLSPYLPKGYTLQVNGDFMTVGNEDDQPNPLKVADSFINYTNDSVLIYTTINIGEINDWYKTTISLDDTQVQEVLTKACNVFTDLSKLIFFKTRLI